MTPIRDHMVYIVVCDGNKGPVICERLVADSDRKTTVDDIRSGQFDDLRQVIEFNPVENTSRDVTEDMLTEAGFYDEPVLTAVDLRDMAFDHARDLRKHERVL